MRSTFGASSVISEVALSFSDLGWARAHRARQKRLSSWSRRCAAAASETVFPEDRRAPVFQFVKTFADVVQSSVAAAFAVHCGQGIGVPTATEFLER